MREVILLILLKKKLRLHIPLNQMQVQFMVFMRKIWLTAEVKLPY
uniref:Uncharacterized protein n=1 Tax=Siphoviridae sp. ctOkv13 TaxID=2826314 RepID=A0A8S5M2R8_9CAUD|nr:MAG TPA: hypothetical protein [Siphoviridae sp. ctOkv13]